MILTLLLFADAVRSVATPMPPVERITPKVAAERVRKCGAGSVKVRSVPEDYSTQLVASDSADLTQEQLVCIDKAARYYDVVLPPALNARFMAIREARSALETKARGRQWLDKRKLLVRLPAYEKGVTDDASFTREIEALCGPAAQGAFQSEYGFHALSPDWMGKQKFSGSEDEPMICLLNVAAASGYELGFIGNERFGDLAE